MDLSEVKGQEVAKRAALIAVAGHHSITFIGGPGVGKRMLRTYIKDYSDLLTLQRWPCPCGYRNDPIRPCVCDVSELRACHPHTDITVEMLRVPFRELMDPTPGTGTKYFREQLAIVANHNATDLRLGAEPTSLLKSAYEDIGLNCRQVASILRVARTIANLDASKSISVSHLAEAINYRGR